MASHALNLVILRIWKRSDREVMRAERAQTTLAAPCTVSGRGYWTGQVNALTFLPAPADSGVRFIRTDLPGHPSVRALAENRSSMPLRTRLSHGRAEVDMVEHVLAALHGLQIDNVLIHCTSSEMPAMDGSSFAFALALNSAGIVQQTSQRQTLWIDRRLKVGTDQQWIMAEPLPVINNQEKNGSPSSGFVERRLELEYQLDFGPASPIPAGDRRIVLTPHDFLEQLSAARTFIGADTARQLKSQGLAQHVTERDLIVFDEQGPVNNRLRFPDECARHKLLDLLGDLALTGMDLVGRITARRGGHQLNGEMSAALRQLALQQGAQCASSGSYARCSV
jgi:UDP-3-O-[3-hydroxymyristoyl] N-acetylglucosamine deacetylase